MKAQVLSIAGEKVEEVDIPPQFNVEVREDLIVRAVRSELSKTYQPKSPYRWAGMETSADYIGNKDAYRTMKNRGHAMLPHEKLPKGRYGRVRRIPFAVTGRRAHPPKVEKVVEEKINKKEYAKALWSGLAATISKHAVKDRTGAEYNVPYIIVDDLESISKTKDVIKLLQNLNLLDDVKKSVASKKRITGVRRKRLGRAYRVRKSVLFIVSKDCNILKSASSIPGVDVVEVGKIKVRDIAPGGKAGRLVVWSKSAFIKMGELA